MKPHVVAALPRYAAGILLAVSHTLAHADDKPALGLFDVYEQNRQTGVANLVTPDLLLVSYSLIRERSAIQQEREVIIPAFSQIIKELLAAVEAGKLKTASQKKAYAFLVTVNALLDGKAPAPIKGFEAIQQEWQLLEAQRGVSQSAILGVQLDYSQLHARGRYSQDDTLKNYFRAFRYASLAHFFAQGSAATGVSPELALELSQTAKLLTDIIAQKSQLKAAYDTLSQQLSWHYGRATELGYQDFLTLQRANPKLNWKKGKPLADALIHYSHQQPTMGKIFDYPVDLNKLTPEQSLADVLVGWRLFSPTFTNDSAAYQALIYPSTGAFIPPCPPLSCIQPWSVATVNGKQVKAYLRGIELLATLAVPEAIQASHFHGENLFVNYAQAQQQASRLLKQDNGLNQLHMQFMADAGQQGTRLESLLGFWTWQRYINLLYSKQSITMTAKSMMLNSPRRSGAMLRGSPAVYQALAKVVTAHQQQQPQSQWDKFLPLLTQLQTLATRANSLTPDDEDFLNGLDKQLLALAGRKDSPIIVDVHTNPNDNMVVEEAIGLPDIIQDGEARGAQFRQYEFKQPQNQRLNNEQWLQALLAPRS